MIYGSLSGTCILALIRAEGSAFERLNRYETALWRRVGQLLVTGLVYKERRVLAQVRPPELIRNKGRLGSAGEVKAGLVYKARGGLRVLVLFLPRFARLKQSMKIFLSSTYQDLIAHREATAQAIERLGQQNVRMEVFGARPLEAASASLEEISDCDALIGLYAHRYGSTPKGQSKSITEQEFDFAMAKEMPIFCFIVNDEYPWPPKQVETEPGRTRLRDFLQRVREKVVADTFTSPEDLAFKVASSLGRFLLYRKVKDEIEKIPAHEFVSTEFGRSQVARRAARIETVIRGARPLLVNDIPEEMSHVIGILRDLGLDVQVETSSDDALRAVSNETYHVVISDMMRGAVEDEGIRFLNRMRERKILFPVIFTVGRFNAALGTPPFAFGITNRVDECLNLVFDALERTRG